MEHTRCTLTGSLYVPHVTYLHWHTPSPGTVSSPSLSPQTVLLYRERENMHVMFDCEHKYVHGIHYIYMYMNMCMLYIHVHVHVCITYTCTCMRYGNTTCSNGMADQQNSAKLFLFVVCSRLYIMCTCIIM